MVSRSDIERMLLQRLEFLMGVGHDMRAPLTGIAGFAAVLSELDSVVGDPTAAEAVGYIRREASRLVEMLNQLLDFGRVELAQGGQPMSSLDLEPIDLARLTNQVVTPLSLLHPQLRFEVTTEGEVIILGDFLRLYRIVSNLLDNAVRHSPAGGSITVAVTRAGDSAELSVADEGPGIPLHQRERVFERFVRLPGTPGEGAGIGLYIVKGLTAAHGGQVRVEDAFPAGARFVVSFPAGSPPAETVSLAGDSSSP
jgi:signal transduction histidine kinase